MGQIVVRDGNNNLTTAALVGNTGQTTKANSLPVTMASDQASEINSGVLTQQIGALTTQQITYLQSWTALWGPALLSVADRLTDINNQSALLDVNNNSVFKEGAGSTSYFDSAITTGKLHDIYNQVFGVTTKVGTSTSQLAKVTSQAAILTSQINTLNTAQIGQLVTTSQLAALNTAQGAQYALSTLQVQAFTTNGGIKLDTTSVPSFGLSQIAGNAIANEGTAQTARGVPTAVTDIAGNSHRVIGSQNGEQYVRGAGELVHHFASLSSSATAFTEGTTGRTIPLPDTNGMFEIQVEAGSSPTVSISGSCDGGATWFALPVFDATTAAAATYPITSLPITSSFGKRYTGWTYGVTLLRFHFSVGSSISASFRYVPLAAYPDGLMSPFGFSAANTTESAGAVNTSGITAFRTGGVRTLELPSSDGTEARLSIDSIGNAANVVQVYLSTNGSTWQQVANLNTVCGSSSSGSAVAVSSVSAAGTWVFNTQKAKYIQVRCTSYTSGTVLGSIRLAHRIKNEVSTGCSTNGIVTFTSTTQALMLSANVNRKGTVIQNQGAGSLYVGLTTASITTASYSMLIPALSYSSISDYVGEIRGLFGSAGTATVTELV